MTTSFGWCFGPEGSTGQHETCPVQIGVLVCGCPCHESAQKSLGMGGLGVAVWENGGTNQQCPEPARTDPGRRPHPAKEL